MDIEACIKQQMYDALRKVIADQKKESEAALMEERGTTKPSIASTAASPPNANCDPAVVSPAPSTTRSTASLRVLSSVVPTDESSGMCASTTDDLSPGARRLYSIIIGGSSSPTSTASPCVPNNGDSHEPAPAAPSATHALADASGLEFEEYDASSDLSIAMSTRCSMECFNGNAGLFPSTTTPATAAIDSIHEHVVKGAMSSNSVSQDSDTHWDQVDVYPPLAGLRRALMTDEEWAAMSEWEKDMWEMKHLPENERMNSIEGIVMWLPEVQRDQRRTELLEEVLRFGEPAPALNSSTETASYTPGISTVLRVPTELDFVHDAVDKFYAPTPPTCLTICPGGDRSTTAVSTLPTSSVSNPSEQAPTSTSDVCIVSQDPMVLDVAAVTVQNIGAVSAVSSDMMSAPCEDIDHAAEQQGKCSTNDLDSSYNAVHFGEAPMYMQDLVQIATASTDVSVIVGEISESNDDKSQDDPGLLTAEVVQFTAIAEVSPTLKQVRAQPPWTEKLKPSLSLEMRLLDFGVMRKEAELWPMCQSTGSDTVLLMPWDPGALRYGMCTKIQVGLEPQWMVSLVEQQPWSSGRVFLLAHMVYFGKLNEKQVPWSLPHLGWHLNLPTCNVEIRHHSATFIPVRLRPVCFQANFAMQTYLFSEGLPASDESELNLVVHDASTSQNGSNIFQQPVSSIFSKPPITSAEAFLIYSVTAVVFCSLIIVFMCNGVLFWPIFQSATGSMIQLLTWDPGQPWYSSGRESLYIFQNFQWTIAWSISCEFSLYSLITRLSGVILLVSQKCPAVYQEKWFELLIVESPRAGSPPFFASTNAFCLAPTATWDSCGLGGRQSKLMWALGIWILFCFREFFVQAAAQGGIILEALTYCYIHYTDGFFDQVSFGYVELQFSERAFLAWLVMPWDPGGSTSGRLGDKPKLKEGGIVSDPFPHGPRQEDGLASTGLQPVQQRQDGPSTNRRKRRSASWLGTEGLRPGVCVCLSLCVCLCSSLSSNGVSS